MTQGFCRHCKRIHYGEHNCMRHVPGHIAQAILCDVETVPVTRRSPWQQQVVSACHGCPHRVGGGCRLIPKVEPKHKACDLGYFVKKGRQCFNDPPRFPARPSYTFPEFPWEGDGGERCVCTVVVGDRAKELADYTLPRMEAFAKKWSAELVALTGDEYPAWPMGNKFRVERVAEKFGRTFYLDIDVWIRGHCPNPFDALPEGQISLFDEHRFATDFFHYDLALLGRRDLLKKTQSFNLGVVMMDRQHAAMWHPPKQVEEFTHSLEQTHNQVNAYDLGFSIHAMPAKWNSIWLWNERHRDEEWFDNDWWDEAYIWHLAGCPHDTRIELFRELSIDDRCLDIGVAVN